MLARLQQFTTLSLLALAAVWAAVFVQRSQLLLAAVGAVSIAFAYALVLAAEFILLRLVNADDPAPVADAATLARAWSAEVAGAARVFFWRQPFRSRAIPDRLSGARPASAGVVFVHGFLCNRGLWNPWLLRLHARGVCFVAVNLEPVFAGIDSYVATIEAAVRDIEAATGRTPIVVAHSMGGLAVRAWLASRGAESRRTQIITIGSPHHGTVLARLARTPNARQMQRDSGWLRELAQRESSGHFGSFTCYYSHCDNIVMPASTATLPGARNRHLPGVAHVRMATDERIFLDLIERISPGSPTDGVRPG